MRILTRILALAALLLLPMTPVLAGADPAPASCPWNSGARPCPCPYDTTTTGVLIPHRFTDGTPYFSCYIATFLKVNWAYVTLFAVVLVMWSGFEYLIAGGDGGKQKAAKQRVIGVFTGLLLYFVIQFIVPLLLGNARV